jgi:hypothetical protein
MSRCVPFQGHQNKQFNNKDRKEVLMSDWLNRMCTRYVQSLIVLSACNAMPYNSRSQPASKNMLKTP